MSGSDDTVVAAPSTSSNRDTTLWVILVLIGLAAFFVVVARATQPALDLPTPIYLADALSPKGRPVIRPVVPAVKTERPVFGPVVPAVDIEAPIDDGHPELGPAAERAAQFITRSAEEMSAAGLIDADPKLYGWAGWAALHGVVMAHHEEPQIAVHMLAAVSNGSYVECLADPDRDPVWQHLIANRAPLRDGMMEVPQGPGFGLVLDEGMIRKYRIN